MADSEAVVGNHPGWKLIDLGDGTFALAVSDHAYPDVLHAPISATTTGDNELVAAVASNKIRVLAAALTAEGIIQAVFESSTSGPDLTGAFRLNENDPALISGASGVMVLPYNPVGWFETVSGSSLNLRLAGGGDAFGCVVYRLIPS